MLLFVKHRPLLKKSVSLKKAFMNLRKNITNLSLTLFGCFLFLSACAKTIPPEAMNNVDRNISFQTLSKNPDAFLSKTVLLGGTIISTENTPQTTTFVVLQHDLDSDYRPLDNDQSRGRFLLKVPEFLDPAIYTKGRRITAAGTIMGREIRQLDGIPYSYPVIERNYLHLWPEENLSDTQPRVYFGIGIGIGNYHYR